MTLLCALWRFMPRCTMIVHQSPCCVCHPAAAAGDSSCLSASAAAAIRKPIRSAHTHTHTHTHIYIYIYIYIHLGCHASRPFRRPVHRQTDPCERLKRQKPVLGLLKRWLLLRFDFQSTLFDFRSTTFDCRSTVIRSRWTVQSQSNRVMVVSSALAALS